MNLSLLEFMAGMHHVSTIVVACCISTRERTLFSKRIPFYRKLQVDLASKGVETSHAIREHNTAKIYKIERDIECN
jgi:hypothetical protein